MKSKFVTRCLTVLVTVLVILMIVLAINVNGHRGLLRWKSHVDPDCSHVYHWTQDRCKYFILDLQNQSTEQLFNNEFRNFWCRKSTRHKSLDNYCKNGKEFGALAGETVRFKGLLQRQLDYKVELERAMLQKRFEAFRSDASLRNLDDMMLLVTPHIQRYYPGRTTYERFIEAIAVSIVSILLLVPLIYLLSS
jgi:hypothetical protein